MQILDTYLKSVARFLPVADRDDIVRELSENLRSQIEDREARIDRPLTDAEVKALLDDFGSPLEVAGRYRQTTGILAFGRVLVGPVLFPFYAKVLGFLLSLTAAAILVIGIALGRPAGSVLAALLVHLSIQFGIVTVIFSLAETGLAKRPNAFDLSQPLSYIMPSGKSDRPRVSRLESLSQLVALGILLAWLPALRGFAREAMSEAGLAPTPIWRYVYVAMACLWCAGIVRAGVALVRPDWIRFWSVARFTLDLAWLAIVLALLSAGRWAAPRFDLGTMLGFAQQRVAEAVNHAFFIGLLVAAVVSVLVVLLDVRRSMSGERALH